MEIPGGELRAVAIAHAVVDDLLGSRDRRERRVDDEAVLGRGHVDEDHAAGAVDPRFPDEVPLVGGRAPVGADRAEHLVGPGKDRGDVVVDGAADRGAVGEDALGEDGVDAARDALGRPEEIGELADEIDAEVGDDAPPGLGAVEEPGGVHRPVMGEHGIGRADPADRAVRYEPLRLLHRRRESSKGSAMKTRRERAAASRRRSGIGEARHHRLFDEHVLAGFEGADGELGVRGVRRGDDDRVDLRIGEEGVEVIVEPGAIAAHDLCRSGNGRANRRRRARARARRRSRESSARGQCRRSRERRRESGHFAGSSFRERRAKGSDSAQSLPESGAAGQGQGAAKRCGIVRSRRRDAADEWTAGPEHAKGLQSPLPPFLAVHPEQLLR